MADLLALLIEVVSVTASGRQMKKPIEVPRPRIEKKKHHERTDAEKKAAMTKGLAMLRGTARPSR